jgi:hypothetical protein
VFENRVLRRIFGPKKDDVTGGWINCRMGSFIVEVEVNLRPTVSRPVYLGVGLPSGAHDQIFVFSPTIVGFLMCGILSDERMGL